MEKQTLDAEIQHLKQKEHDLMAAMKQQQIDGEKTMHDMSVEFESKLSALAAEKEQLDTSNQKQVSALEAQLSGLETQKLQLTERISALNRDKETA